MSDYTISFKDEASPVAQRIQQSVAAMRSELKAVGAVRIGEAVNALCSGGAFAHSGARRRG